MSLWLEKPEAPEKLHPAARFLALCSVSAADGEDNRRRMQRWSNVDQLVAMHRGEDLCLALADQSLPPLPTSASRQYRRLVALASLGLWRTAAVTNGRLPQDERPTEIALRASDVHLTRGFSTAELQRRLTQAQEAEAKVELLTGERVRCGMEGAHEAALEAADVPAGASTDVPSGRSF